MSQTLQQPVAATEPVDVFAGVAGMMQRAPRGAWAGGAGTEWDDEAACAGAAVTWPRELEQRWADVFARWAADGAPGT